MSEKFHVYVCARTKFDTTISERDLSRSPAIAKDVALTVFWDQESAAIAFAAAIERATADYLLITHCDVYFPERWFERLTWEVDRLTRMDPNWAVAGFAGVTAEGELAGRVLGCSLDPWTRGIFGKPLVDPVPIVSADELAIVVNRKTGITLDPKLPEFHLYATDIILAAERAGKRSYGLDVPLIHNTEAQLYVWHDYRRSYHYMVQKWRTRLPVPTTCGPHSGPVSKVARVGLGSIVGRRNGQWLSWQPGAEAFSRSGARSSRQRLPRHHGGVSASTVITTRDKHERSSFTSL